MTGRTAMASVGPYDLLETLGRGGMGVVSRARHRESGRLVALKTVAAAQPGVVGSLRREIRSLARLRHPGVVRIVDDGVHQGLPWYAMELVAGRSLRAVAGGILRPTLPSAAGEEVAETVRLDRDAARVAAGAPGDAAPDGNPPVLDAKPLAAGGRLPGVLSLVAGICEPLGYLHGEGIVHRDLKPENVIVRDDGQSVLVDFGLTASVAPGISRDELQVAGGMSGTIAYMAPEQVRGELLDPRADLYALGCILYELVTGSPPFCTGSPAEVLAAHLSRPPVPASARCDGVPPGLDELLSRMLAKEPRERVGHADAVSAALRDLGADVPAPGPPARPYLYRSRLLGREAALAKASERLRALRVHGGGLLAVTGEAGVGRTRFASEVGAVALWLGIDVLVAGEPAGATAPGPLEGMRGVLRALADRCHEGGPAATERLLGPTAGSILADYEPALGDVPGLEGLPRAPVLGPAESRQRLMGALTEVVCRAAGTPVLVLLDDLHATDELTVAAVAHLARSERVRGLPLLLVVTCRAGEEPPAFRDAAGAASAGRIELARLEDGLVKELAADMLAQPHPPDDLTALLAERSAGNPFMVGEHLRAAVAAGLLVRDRRGTWELPSGAAALPGLGTPSSIRELAALRLSALPSQSREVLDAAAVAGRSVDEGLLAAIAGVGEGAAEEAAAILVSRGIVEGAGSGLLRFPHEALRETAYEALSAGRRRELHRRAAAALAERGGEPSWSAEEARHWDLGGERDRAAAAYLRAGRHASSMGAHAEAARLLGACLALGSLTPERALALRRERAMGALRFGGKAAEALAELREVAESARDPGLEAERVHARSGVAVLLWETGRMEEAERTGREALAEARALGMPRLVATALANLGAILADRGRPSEAEPFYREALALEHDAAEEARLHLSLAALAHDAGDLAGAVARYGEARALARAAGSRPVEAIATGNLAIATFESGAAAEARSLFEASVEMARESGLARIEGIMTSNLADLVAREEPGRAMELFQRALGLLRDVGDRPYEAVALLGIGDCDLRAGRLAEARGRFEAALAIHHDIEDPRYEGSTLLRLAAVASRRGDAAEQGRLLGRAEACLRRVEDPEALAACLCERAELEAARGAPFQELVTEARALLAPRQAPAELLDRLARVAARGSC